MSRYRNSPPTVTATCASVVSATSRRRLEERRQPAARALTCRSSLKTRLVTRSPSSPGGPQPKPRALIGFAEAVAGPETAFSLIDAGFEVVAFTRAGAAASLRKCHDVRLVEGTTPRDDTLAAVRELEQHVEGLDPAG